MGSGHDFFCQRRLAPSELACCLDVPRFLLDRQLRFQDNHVLGPADGHGFGQHLRGLGIGPVKIPHPPQVPGGEAGNVRVGAVQVLCRRHRRTFLRPAADQSANLAI